MGQGRCRPSGEERLRAAVIMGGAGPERDVSLASGQEVVRALDPDTYAVKPVIIDRSGRWRVAPRYLDVPVAAWGPLDEMSAGEAATRLCAEGVDVAVLALHGPLGEDGTVQGFFETAGIPYTGPSVEAAVLAMNKAIARRLIAAAGVLVPAGVEVESGADPRAIRDVPGPPWVVKPARLGSSIGVSIVRSAGGVGEALEIASREDTLVLVEEFIAGTEVSCPVLERDGGPEALPVIAIAPAAGHSFFDFGAKYRVGGAEEIVPAPIPDDATLRIQEAAVAVHRTLGCGVLSRTDFILRADGQPVALETNTIPGMTSTSLVPKSARAAGISFPEILDALIDGALRRAGAARARVEARA
ncbi:MAG: D-alanine--D-alanine ligase [Planctomycetes bacterium]|nr:D-alanine--D-alanine ligase [Planctomycetota bacterium]